MLSERFEEIENPGCVGDHSFEGFNAREIVPTETIPYLYRQGAFDLHLHIRRQGLAGSSHLCAVTDNVPVGDRVMVNGDRSCRTNKARSERRDPARDYEELVVLVGVLEGAELGERHVFRVFPMTSEVVRLHHFNGGHCGVRKAAGHCSPSFPGSRLKVLARRGVHLVDVVREDRERGFAGPLIGVDHGDGQMVQGRAQVEHQLADDDRRHGVVDPWNDDTMDVDLAVVLGLQPFAHVVHTVLFDRRETGAEVTEVMLRPRHLLSP